MENQKKKTLVNYKKTQSLITTIIGMVEKDKYCIDIMHLNLAAIGLLKSAQQMLMENHVNTCFKNGMSSGNKKKKADMIDEILKVSKLSNK